MASGHNGSATVAASNGVGPKKPGTMTKLKGMFGHHNQAAKPAPAPAPAPATATPQPTSKSQSSSLDSSRANTPPPPQTPLSSPEIPSYPPYMGNLPRQPSSNNILTASLIKQGNGGSKQTSPAPSIHSVTSGSVVAQYGSSRCVVYEEGQHEHHLKSTRRQEKLGGMLREMLGGTGKKVRDDAVSAMPEFVDNNSKDLSLMSGLVSQIQNGERDLGKLVNGAGATGGGKSGTQTPMSSLSPVPSMSNTNLAAGGGGAAAAAAPSSSSAGSGQSLVQKYGKCQEIIGRGAYGIVRVAHKYDHVSRREVLFAVKEFKKRPQENAQNFSKRLASEFCISSSLHHSNIIHTLDLMKDARGECCEVMEYCAGGDLYSLILSSDGGLEAIEADCFFKQLMKGVVYMHSMGVAHCDLKPENLLLTCNGVLKISDFGNGECFRMAWEKEIHMSSGVCGSRPYIAPEEFRDAEFDPRAVDIWATGVIYMAMRTGSYLWQVAIPDEDEFYRRYLTGRKQSNGYEPVETLKRSRCRNVIYSILDPIPSRRITGKQVLNSEWGRSIQLCDAATVY